MPILCPECRKSNPIGSLSCMHCGAVIPADARAEEPTPHAPAEPGGEPNEREAGERDAEAKANAHAEFIAAASVGSDAWLPASQLRLWGWITVLVPVAGLVVGALWLLRRQRGVGCFLVLALLTNVLYGALVLLVVLSMMEGQLMQARLVGLRSIYQAEKNYYDIYGSYADFEELQEEGLLAGDSDIAVQDAKNATDAAGTTYKMESLTDDGFVVVGRHRRLGAEQRINEAGLALEASDSGTVQDGYL